MDNILNYSEMFDVSSGRTLTKTGPKAILQDFQLLLSSSLGELFGDPSYGCSLMELVHNSASDKLRDDIKSSIINAVNKFIPDIGISMNNIEVNIHDESIQVILVYKIISLDQVGQYSIEFSNK